MGRTAAICFLVISVLCCGQSIAQSESGSTADETKAATAASQENPRDNARQHDNNIEPYRLDFSFSELEDGKKINMRRYSMNLTAGNEDEIRIGTKVPVQTGPPQTAGSTDSHFQYQYMEAGTRIWASLKRRGDGVELQVRSEITSLDKTDTHDHDTGWLPPVLRSINISGTTLLVTAKPMLIGSTDDPYSNREFQLEVTATKLR